MKAALVLLALATGSELAAAAPRSAAWAITRKTATTLPADPGERDVRELLVDSHWFQHNPQKQTSKWDRRSFVFLTNGFVSVMRDDGSKPVLRRWKLVRVGKRPVITIDGTRLSVDTCTLPDETVTVCLFGKLPS
jgi:hypothetical protein